MHYFRSKKFSISNVIVNNSSNTVSIFSELEIPADVELELFNLEGKQIEIHRLESGPHEILISTEGLSTNAYFLRLKNQETVKTYKFFHLR
ncbi:MAG: T9SS type A sorting domain-containing protein [Saprospiraceae bacterium]|nr:T9SS type A sorting domain-containing protein [Saprospiraceae bacterium]